MFRPMKFQETAICKLQLNCEEIYVEFSIHSKGVCVIDNNFWYNINVYYSQHLKQNIFIKYT